MQVEEWFEEDYKTCKLNTHEMYPNQEFLRFLSKYFLCLNLNERKTKKILELGCGLGSNLIPIINENLHAYAIDISKKCIDLTKQRLKDLCLSGQLKGGANLLSCNCLEIDTHYDFKFDGIVDIFSLYCLTTIEFKNLLQKIYNKLNTGGLFYSFFPSKNSTTFTNYKPAKLIDDSTLNGIYRETSPYFGNFYNFRFMYPLEYKLLLEKYKFKVLEINTIIRNDNLKETFEYISITAIKE